MVDPITGGAAGAIAERAVASLWSSAKHLFDTGADAFLNPVVFKDPADPQFLDDFYKLLLWNKRYSPFLRGRGEELNMLVEWAEGEGLQIAILSGVGGAGKSRLAAELAYKLVNERKFVAGTLKRGADNLPPKQPPGKLAKSLLAIVDYAEERLEHVKAALERFANWGDDPERCVRVLLLVRTGQEKMLANMLRRLDLADALTHLDLPRLGVLPVEEALALANDVRAKMVGNGSFKDVEEEAFTEHCRQWLRQDEASETNRLPLYVMAAALHALEKPDEGFTLSGRKLLKALALREFRRASTISEKLGLGEYGVPRLVALATLVNGLGTGAIYRLKDTLLFEKLDADALKRTPWWDSEKGILAPLQPDRPAAAFVAEALLTGDGYDPDALPQWLAAALMGREEDFCRRLPRISNDIISYSIEDGIYNLSSSILEAVRVSHDISQKFKQISLYRYEERVPLYRFVARIILKQSRNEYKNAGLIDLISFFVETYKLDRLIESEFIMTLDDMRYIYSIYKENIHVSYCSNAPAELYSKK